MSAPSFTCLRQGLVCRGLALRLAATAALVTAQHAARPPRRHSAHHVSQTAAQLGSLA